MTLLYIILILLQAGILVYFMRRGRMQAKTEQETEVSPAPVTYEEVRKLAINVTPGQLNLTIPPAETLVYGVVMDWDMGNAITTLAAYITGAASLGFSTGGVVKGGGLQQGVGEAASEFVVAAQDYFDRAIPINTTDLPSKGCVRFYFLTNNGISAAQENTKHFDDCSSPWLNLFLKANVVISEIQGMVN
jgi:hypothetical protein